MGCIAWKHEAPLKRDWISVAFVWGMVAAQFGIAFPLGMIAGFLFVAGL